MTPICPDCSHPANDCCCPTQANCVMTIFGKKVNCGQALTLCPESHIITDPDDCNPCIKFVINWCAVLGDHNYPYFRSVNNSIDIQTARGILYDQNGNPLINPKTGNPQTGDCFVNFEVKDQFFVTLEEGSREYEIFCRSPQPNGHRRKTIFKGEGIDISVQECDSNGNSTVTFSTTTGSVAKDFLVGCKGGNLSDFTTVSRPGGSLRLTSDNCSILKLEPTFSQPGGDPDGINFKFLKTPVTSVGRTNDGAAPDEEDRPVLADAKGFLETDETLKNNAGKLSVDFTQICGGDGFFTDKSCFTDKTDVCAFFNILQQKTKYDNKLVGGQGVQQTFTKADFVTSATFPGMLVYERDVDLSGGASSPTTNLWSYTMPNLDPCLNIGVNLTYTAAVQFGTTVNFDVPVKFILYIAALYKDASGAYLPAGNYANNNFSTDNGVATVSDLVPSATDNYMATRVGINHFQVTEGSVFRPAMRAALLTPQQTVDDIPALLQFTLTYMGYSGHIFVNMT